MKRLLVVIIMLSICLSGCGTLLSLAASAGVSYGIYRLTNLLK